MAHLSDPFGLTPRRIALLSRALSRLARPDVRITSLDFLDDLEIALLVAETRQQTFRVAQPEIAHKGRRVFQDFDVCFPAPRVGAFDALAGLLETAINSASMRSTYSLFCMVVIVGAYVLGLPTPSSSIFLTKLASVNLAGGRLNFCLA